MALALNCDLNSRLASLVPVDMSPNVEPIEDQYNGYARGMKEIAAAGVNTRAAADKILQKYEPVSNSLVATHIRSNLQGSSCSPTPSLSLALLERPLDSAFRWILSHRRSLN